MYPQYLFPVVDKSGTSCYHFVTRLMTATDSQQVVPTNLISSSRNNDDKLVPTCHEQPVFNSPVGISLVVASLLPSSTL